VPGATRKRGQWAETACEGVFARRSAAAATSSARGTERSVSNDMPHRHHAGIAHEERLARAQAVQEAALAAATGPEPPLTLDPVWTSQRFLHMLQDDEVAASRDVYLRGLSRPAPGQAAGRRASRHQHGAQLGARSGIASSPRRAEL
jgi:hypothetical protein